MREKFLGGGVTYMCCVSYLQVVCWHKIGSATALFWMLSLLVLLMFVLSIFGHSSAVVE